MKSLLASLIICLSTGQLIAPNKFAGVHEEKQNQFTSNEVPSSIMNWLNKEVAKSKKKKLTKYTKDNFFKTDSSRIVGYIQNYDKNSIGSAGIFYHSNDLTREEFPKKIKIHEDGRFEVAFEANYPIKGYYVLNNISIPFYIEPGMTLGVVLDAKEHLVPKESRNEAEHFKTLIFLGPAKSINEELLANSIQPTDFIKLDEYRNTISPTDFKKMQMNLWSVEKKQYETKWINSKISDQAKTILRNEIDLKYANYLLDYARFRDDYRGINPTNEILKIDIDKPFYDFLKEIDLSNPFLLTLFQFKMLISEFENSILYRIPSTNKGKYNFELIDSIYSKNYDENKLLLLFNIAKLREIEDQIENNNLDNNLPNKINLASKSFNYPFLLEEIQRLYKAKEIKKLGYDLPNTEVANTFKKIIAPHQGKVLVVDFWAENCGPCREGIESSLALRTKLKDNEILEFIYITDVDNTSENFFKEYGEKNLMKNSHRVSADDYLALRELFKFNGIPQYALIDENGRVKDDDFNFNNIAFELSTKFPDKFNTKMFQASK